MPPSFGRGRVNNNYNNIFNTTNQFFEKEELNWSKCKVVTTDGAAAMQGSQKGVIEKLQELSPYCVGIHCILHHEVLVTKKLKTKCR